VGTQRAVRHCVSSLAFERKCKIKSKRDDFLKAFFFISVHTPFLFGFSRCWKCPPSPSHPTSCLAPASAGAMQEKQQRCSLSHWKVRECNLHVVVLFSCFFFFFFLSCCLVTLSQRCVRDRETERRLKRQRFDFLRRNVFFFLIFSFDLSYDQLLLKALFLFLLWLISCPVQAKKKRNILARSIDKL
jgi:hypothetical protein